LLLASRDGQTVDVDDVYASAALALEAFALLLEEEEWLLGGDGKGGATLLDAGLFAYTQLLLDEKMGWKDRRLVKAVLARPKLVAHRERMLQRYWR
jgi:metaxin